MAAPTTTARGIVNGEQFYDGFPTTITFKGDATIELWEIEVQPPSLDTGDAIPCTTMLNAVWRTSAPPTLQTLGNVKATVAYNQVTFDAIVAILGTNDEITVRDPDGSQLAFWGFLKSFVPGNRVEGAKPTAEIEIVPTNRDLTGVIFGPVYTEVP